MSEHTGKMPENLKINIDDPEQLAHWSAALQVSAEKLQAAVSEVGPNVGDVCRKLHVMPANPGTSNH